MRCCLGPREREEGTRVPGKGTAAQRGATRRHGVREMIDEKRIGSSIVIPNCSHSFLVLCVELALVRCTPCAHAQSATGWSCRSAVPGGGRRPLPLRTRNRPDSRSQPYRSAAQRLYARRTAANENRVTPAGGVD